MNLSRKSRWMTKERRSFRSKILLFLFLALAVFSCGRGNAGNIFRTYIQSDPGILDPFYSTDVVSGKILAAFCDGLLRTAPDGTIAPDLAERWSFDGTTFSCTLRKGLRFSDGSSLTASDVKYSILRIRDSSNPTSPRKSFYTQIREFSASDDGTIAIRLTRPNMSFPWLLTQVNSYVISEKAMTEHGTILGSGPFKISHWLRDDRIELVRNSFYHGTPAQVDGITFRIIPEDLTARFEFMNGTIDYFELPYLSSAVFDSTKFKTDLIPELCVHYISINTSRPPFDDVRFRRALNMAVDRQTICTRLFGNRFTPAAGSVPPGTGRYKGTALPIEYDPERAKAVIQQLGLTGKSFTLNCKAEHQISLAAQMIQQYLEAAGLHIELHEMEWGALKNVTNAGRYDMALFNWFGDYPDAENFLRPLFHSANKGSGGNRSFYENRQFDALVEKAALTVDEQQRNALYARAEQLIVDDAPWIFLWNGGRRLAFSKRVSRFVSYPVYNGMKGNEIILDSAH